MSNAKVSIIIRTRDEESWVGHCLEMVFKQDFTDFEVIIVDNESRDHTLHTVKRFAIKEVVAISEYLPGLALNMGVEKTVGEYIVCLSSHCIPQKKKLAVKADIELRGFFHRRGLWPPVASCLQHIFRQTRSADRVRFGQADTDQGLFFP